PYWQAHDAELLSAGLGAIARRLPTLVRDAVGVAWQASRADTAATLGLNVLAGLFTAFGLLATNDVLESLFAAGATADRVRAAIPALLVVAAAAGLRAGMLAVA